MKLGYAAALLALAACVPADAALGLGSVQFTITSSNHTRNGISPGETTDGYSVSFDRVLIGYKTMTVGKIGAPDTCSYRGRGEASNVVFNPVFGTGLVQTFNGIQPVECPDVGMIFGPPDNATVPANGATGDDLVELAGRGYHALIDATASTPGGAPYRIEFRFTPDITSTRFGGCREATRGVRIFEGVRDSADVYFAAENLFRSAISNTVKYRVEPFIDADINGDYIVTMDELDQYFLYQIADGVTYQVPSSPTSTNIIGEFASLGDYVRFLFRFVLLFRSENGSCVGNEPGIENATP